MQKTGLVDKKILLPNLEDMTAWACIACDQFTSEIEYWKQLEVMVGDKYSTLNLVLPEIYLEDNADERIKKINKNIKDYLKTGVFKQLENGFILTIRKTPYVARRIGLIGAIDLEEYEYSKKSSALIRSTEGTIEERIPPRLKIREKADVEFPHIMVLFDDEKREITDKLYEERQSYKKVYDFDLNMNGGHVEGYFIPDVERVKQMFSNLLDEKRLVAKYGKNDKFAFAVGDGNHSLATAKTHWNKVKQGLTEQEKLTHPARFALVEFVNIYDEGIYFEPIHRYVTGIDRAKFLSGLNDIDCGNVYTYDGKSKRIRKSSLTLPEGIMAVDNYVKEYIAKNGGAVDYIHGDENLTKLVDNDETAVGIFFEKLDKDLLFRYVSSKGAFPRKTFSMGEGIEKRYYLEGSRITHD